MDKAKILADRYRTVRSEYDSGMSFMHQEVMNYAMPRKSNVTETRRPGTEDWSEGIYDDEAINGAQVLAAGQLDWLFSGNWVEAQCPYQEAPQDLKDWYKRTGEIALDVLNGSNFPLEIHEFLLDRSSAATAHLHCEEDDDDILFFMNDDVGHYVVEENYKGLVDKWWGCRKFTADQAVEKWGEDNVGPSVVQAFNEPNGKGRGKEFEFIFFIGPRSYNDRLYGSMAPKDKEWAFIVVNTKDNVTVEEGGYDEKPFVVSRYLKWGRSPYGYGPAMLALSSIREVNGGEKLYSVLCELQAFPRMLIPHDLEGMVGFGPSGVTIYNSATGNKPEEWATSGRGDIFENRLNGLRAKIRRAFHVELFQMLTNMEEVKREKTAYEVSEMLAEKISHFTPTFQRLRVEVLKPLLNRVFSICFRKGVFPAPPDSLYQFTNSEVEFPRFEYTSKLAKAIRANENLAWGKFVESVRAIFELDPSMITQEINLGRATRTLADNFGMPLKMLNTPEERDEIIQKRKADEEAAKQMQMAEMASKAAKNLSGAPQLANIG